ncbi:MAG: UDP binding domain-containing protein [Paenacidovorax caeni]
MPHWVVEKITDALNERSKAIKGSRILVLGLAYKKNIDDTRESPAVEIMDLLQAKGAHIDYSDPHVPVFPRKRDYHFDLQSVTRREHRQLRLPGAGYRLRGFDYPQLLQHARPIVDTRGRLGVGTVSVVAA